jgi:hypothetical protein
MTLSRDLEAIYKEAGELEDEVERLRDVEVRMKLGVDKHLRLTKLLRAALPEAAQVGNGLEGMVQSLLALVVRQGLEESDE